MNQTFSTKILCRRSIIFETAKCFPIFGVNVRSFMNILFSNRLQKDQQHKFQICMKLSQLYLNLPFQGTATISVGVMVQSSLNLFACALPLVALLADVPRIKSLMFYVREDITGKLCCYLTRLQRHTVQRSFEFP